MHVLFICTGNLCRSPIAERFALAHAKRLAVRGLRVSSAGTRAVVGRPMNPDSASVLEELGGDATGFAARQLTKRILADADLVVAMERRHRDAVLELSPTHLHRTFTLHEIECLVTRFGVQRTEELSPLRSHIRESEGGHDVPDPMGRGHEIHRIVGERIATSLVSVFHLFQ